MIMFYPIVVTILGFALPAGETPSVRFGGVNPTKLEDGGKNKKVHGLKGWTAEFIELHPDTLGGRDAIQSTVKDDISKDKTVSIATILGFHTTEPSSKGMLAKTCARDVEDITDPLDMVERAWTFLNELRAETGTTKVAIPALGEDVVVGERDEKEEDGEGGIALAKKDHALVKGKMVATTLSPTNLMCSALKACSTSHVDALGEGEEGGASAFEEAKWRWNGWIAEKQGCVLNVSPLSFAATACSASVVRSDSDDSLDEVKKVATRDRSLMGAETPWEDRAPGQSKMSNVVLFPSKMTNKNEANIKLVDGRVFNSVLAIVDASFSIVAEDLSTSEETLKATIKEKYDATVTLFDDDSIKSVPAIARNAICKVLTYPNKIHEHQIMMTGKTNGAFSENGPEKNSRNIALLFGTPALKRQRPENNAWHPVFKGESAGGYRVSSKACKSPAHSTHLECNIAVSVQTFRFCFSIKLPTIGRATCGGTSAEENSGSLNSEGTCVIAGNKLHVTTAHRCNFSDASYDLLESSSDEIIWSELEDGLGDDVFVCSCACWFQADTDDIVYISLHSKIMSIIGSSQTIANTGSIISVLSGGTLLIESGVTCIFEDAASGIIVRSGGQLLITGVDNNRVFLQARLASWAGITFLTGSKSAEFGVDDEYVSGSIIQNANISRAGYSRSSGLSLSEGATPYLNNVGMLDCGAIVIRNLRGSFVANKLSIMRMDSFTGPVIDIRGTGMNSGRTVLREVVVQARSGYSLLIANIHFASVAQASFNGEVYFETVEKVTVENNIIAPYSPTNRYAIYMTGIASEASYISRNHLFSKIYVDDSSITIAENIIQESVIGGIMVTMRNEGDAIHILNNIITKCKPSSDVVSLIFAAGSLHFANNMIAENQGRHLFSLEAQQSSGSLQFANNTIVQNHAMTIFYLMGHSRTYITTRNILSNVVSSNIGTEALLKLYGFPLGSFAENLFANNSAPMSVDVNMPNHDEDTIELPRNYWGEFQADVVDLRASVGDILTTKSLGPIVDFNPVLKDFSPESDLIPVNLPGLFMSDGSIGGVVRNKSLTLAGGHFIANMSIVIIDGGSLEIGPNSTVSFALSRAIVVKNSGKLGIAGPTTLRAKDASKFWNGIHIQTSNDTAINGSFIRDASVGIRTTQQSSGLLSIYNAEFENVLVGLQLESSSPLAAVSLILVNISSSSGSGIDAGSFQGRLNVTNSTISSNRYHGLISNYGHDLVLVNNSIDTRSSSYTSLDIYRDKSVIVTGNKITCLASCLSLTVHNSHIRVDDNVFSGAGAISGSSQARIVMESPYIAVQGYNSFSVQGNSFSNWNSPSNDAVYVQLQQQMIANHTIRLSSNDFRGIKARHVLYLDFLSSATPTNIANVFDQSLVVTDSVFYIQNWPKSCGSATCTLVGNIFNSPLSLGQHHIWVSESANSVASIDASLSYWGSEDESKVIGSIYDGRDNLELTTIEYLPYLLTPDPAGNRSTNKTSLTFLRQGNILNGILGKGENVTLYFTGSPYKTDGTLIIDGYLEIKANVTIQVKDGSSILIRRNGTMKAIGTADMPISFEKLDEERWAGLVVEGVADLQHINIREGGHGGDFCLSIKRPSSFVYKNIRIQEGMGNGLSVEGDGDFALENLRIESTTPSFGIPTSVHIAGQANVDMNGLFISTSHSGHAIYAYGITRLSIKNAEIYPLSVLSKTPSLYLAAESYELDNFVFKASSQTHSASIGLAAKDGSITNSYIIGTGLLNVDVGGRYNYYNYDGYVKINNVTFVGTNINANANNVSFVKNSFSGSTNINANANNVSFVKNSFSGSTNNPTHCVNSQSMYFEATSNEVTNYTSHSELWLIDASNSVLLSSNAFENCHVRGQYSLFAMRSSGIAIKDNILSNVTARAIFQFLGSINSINFIRNAIIDPHVQFYVMTSSSYASVADGTLKIGPNFWSTTSFEELNLGAFDSSYDSSLATIEFLSLFIDPRMEDIIFAPSSQVFDKDRKRISGTIADDLVIVVPPGLYYAPGSIILRHPKAQLVIMAGAHIIFAEYASIRVDQGALKILGDDRNSVYLTPTSAAQYNDTIENSTIFDGILFGPNSNGTVFGDNMEYVAGSIIRHCEVKYGGYYKSSATIRLDEVSVMLDHVTIIGQWGRSVDGILFIRPSGPVFLRSVNISNAGGSGIVVSEAKRISSFADVNIHGCYREGLVIRYSKEAVIVRSTFDGNGESSEVNSQVYSYGGTGDFNVTSCLFVNSKDVGFESIYVYYSSWPGSRRYSVTSSNFTQLQRPIFINDASSIEFAMNRFYNNSCTLSSCQSIAISFLRDFVFRGNVVEDNSASQILRINATSGANSVPNIAIAGNIFQSNQVPSYSYSSSSAVLAMSGNTNSTWHLQGNEFNNPLSLYEMRTSEFSVSDPKFVKVNATYNIFAIADEDNPSATLIDSRIYDDDEGPYPVVSFEPYLNRSYTATCISNCTDHGLCVYPGICICRNGWSGESCDVPTCSTLKFCNGHGKCSAFDTCTCDIDWLGSSCDIANCTLQNNCNNNGFCPVPNICSCFTGYDGIECDECASNYRMTNGSCVPCPVCRNGGLCSAEAKCACPFNYVGHTCESCAEGYFGVACLPLPFILDALPTDASDTGGIEIRLVGYNFASDRAANTSVLYECRFGSIAKVNATLISDNELACVSPKVQLSNGLMEVDLSVTVDYKASYNSVPFVFYGLCPENQCSHGYCSFGRCVCHHGYRGDDCSDELIAPIITSPPTVIELLEGKPFSYQLQINQGSKPIQWALIGKPINGIVLDAESGVISWTSPTASSGLFYIKVQATNELSRSDAIEFVFHVSPSYYVVVSTAPVSYIRPSPIVYFDVLTLDMSTNGPIGDVPAVFWVQEQGSLGHRRKVTVKTNPFGAQRGSYQPYSTDAGVFLYGGEHPMCTNLTVQGQIMIMGVDVIPNYYYFRGFPLDPQSIESAFLFRFKGGSFSGIDVTFDQGNDFSIVPSLNSSTANATSDTLAMSLNISSSTGLRGRVYFNLSTTEGLSISSSYVFMDIKYRTPILHLSSDTIDVKAEAGGAPKYYDVMLQNVGTLASGSIEVIFATDGCVRPVSENIPALAVDEVTLVSFRVLIPENTAVGTVFVGEIGFVSNNSDTVILEFRVTTISSVSTTLTIITQNEATFFSEEKSNLDDVDVRVRSLTVGTVYMGNSGTDGTIIFTDMVEDFYEVIAQKSGHTSFTRRIFLESPGQIVEAFLSFESVSYTFRVVPVSVVDRYKIIVESTFTTHVPKPVILWEPLHLDFESLRSGHIDSFDMSATNVGLIAVENLTFWLPAFWENVAFITPKTKNLGRLSANSTLSFPVEVSQINRYEIPQNMTEMRDPLNPNNVFFLPVIDDARWDTGLDFISISASNPTKPWYYKFDTNGRIDIVYRYSDRTRYDFIYDNQTKIPSDIIITNNTNLTDTRKLSVDVPPPVLERRLGIVNFSDCVDLFACITCKMLWEAFLAYITGGGSVELKAVALRALKNRKVYQKMALKYGKMYDDIMSGADNFKASKYGQVYEGICDQVDSLKSIAEVELPAGTKLTLAEIPFEDIAEVFCLAKNLGDKLMDFVEGVLDPCQYICPEDETVGGGCAYYDCAQEIAMK
ncbi:hypothetical protein ACHAW5_008354 [Stephanodiscus triporus]|uniref:EGF-like domain-containing protein n=1 Tax=Stephanodiscus triporus TaxID=2934178 RepID=A0ABD3PRB5_9STRA